MSDNEHCPACGWDYSRLDWESARQVLASLAALGVRLPPERAICPVCFVGWLAAELDRVQAPVGR
jgi:hypothetical protein